MHRTFAALLVAATLCASPGSASAVDDTIDEPTIVLVHGAWANADTWDGVARRLTKEGYDVLIPENPLRSPASDAAHLQQYLDDHTDGPVVLVGHSYGGTVISAVHDPDVQALVYVNGFIPAEGDYTFGLAGEKPGSHLTADPATVFDAVPYPGAPEGDVDLYVKEHVFVGAFGNDLPRRTAVALAGQQRPLTLFAGLEKAGPPSWASTPSFSLIGTIDNVIPVAQQRAMSARAGAETTEVTSGHLSMLSRPRAVTLFIQAAVDG